MTARVLGRLVPFAGLALSLACGGGSGGNPTVYYTLAVQKSGTGSGTVTGGVISCGATCTASLASGTAVTLTATPDASSTFVSWAGCDTSVGATCNVTMNASKTVTATFNQNPGSLYVVNSTSYTITELYVSPAGAGTWGPNQLVSPIVPSGAFTLVDIPAGSYDFRAVASDGITFWQTNSVAITAGSQSTWTLLPPAVGSLSVVNGTTSYTIAELYVSPAGAGTWGPNQLVSPIAPSGTFTLTNIPVGGYDFMAVASDGISYWQTNAVSVTDGGLVTWTLLPPEVGSLSVVNQHCVALTELYVRPSSSPTWSPNQLAVPVDPMGTFTLTGIPVGIYDLSAVAIDGLTWMTPGASITVGGTFTWSLFMPAGTGCLSVVNNTVATINFLFDPPSPSGCGGNVWGTEQLAGATILPGLTFTLSNVPPGAHDLRAVGVAPLGPVDYRVCGMGIPSGGTFTWYLGGPP